MNQLKRSLRRCLLCYVVATFALLLAFLAGTAVLVRHEGQRELEAALAETDRLDPRWRLQDLEADRGTEPAPEQNGFRQVEAIIWDASTAKPPVPNQAQDARDRFGIGLLPKDQAELLRPLIDRAKIKLDRARGVTAFPRGRGESIIPKEGEAYVNSRPILGFLDLSKGLCADARLRIFDRDISGAFQDCLAVFHIGGTLANKPDLMAQLVRAAIDLRACDLVEQLLSTGKCSAGQLADLQRIVEAELASPRILLGIRAERAHFDWMLEQVQNGTIPSQKLEEIFMGVLGPRQGLVARGVQYFRYSLLISNLPGQRARRLRASNELISVGQLPYAERIQALRNLDEKWRAQSAAMFGWLDSAPEPGRIYANYVKEELAIDAILSNTIVAIATERYRQEHLHWPTSLDELSPRYLKTLPLDPYTGEPLHLLRKGPALVIYSVGENLKDDGGMLANRFATGGMDNGFVLLDPDQLQRAEKVSAYLERMKKSLKKVVGVLEKPLPRE